jgi:hypothetical protein
VKVKKEGRRTKGKRLMVKGEKKNMKSYVYELYEVGKTKN